ncbi:MAG: hypothetical protein J1E36_00530, partial [Eubacterium sp.]|nr:hypothetical protein [Eubacterium sp.]
MNKKTKTEQLERLFEEWQQEQINEPKETLDKTMLKDAKIVRFNSFCKDGIICEEQFEKEKIKVLFIGNEPNIDNKKDIEDWKKGKEFPLVTSQISDFNNYFDEHHDDWTGKLRQRICEVIYPAMLEPHKNAFPVENGWVNAKKIAFMNLNKRGGKGNIEDHLKNYCNEYKEYIKKEISIINPDIIIWLGKSSFDMCNNTLFDNN